MEEEDEEQGREDDDAEARSEPPGFVEAPLWRAHERNRAAKLRTSSFMRARQRRELRT